MTVRIICTTVAPYGMKAGGRAIRAKEVARSASPVMAVERPDAHGQGAECAAWSAVHGLSHLLVDGPLRELPERDVQLALDVTLSMISRGL